jgi:branched-subunit amino acid transport protein
VIWFAIGGMCLVTFLPRVIPLVLGRDLVLPAWIRRWLSFFPFAALGALIFPGILGVVDGKPWIGLAAGACAGIIAMRVRTAIIPVLSAIAVAIVLQLVAGS